MLAAPERPREDEWYAAVVGSYRVMILGVAEDCCSVWSLWVFCFSSLLLILVLEGLESRF